MQATTARDGLASVFTLDRRHDNPDRDGKQVRVVLFLSFAGGSRVHVTLALNSGKCARGPCFERFSVWPLAVYYPLSGLIAHAVLASIP